MPERVSPLRTREPPPDDDGIIKLAILAVGGQGGGVLADWIVDVAERNGYIAQSTSVPGVAQRTGATIYYIEMCRDTRPAAGLSLMPSPGDVDIVIAAELMEAGRAIMRGFVTPDRTTLIASSHRIAAVSEKIEPGDGRASSAKVLDGRAKRASKRFIAFDMEKIAVENGSMISASLFGALAGSGALPFPRESYEPTIAAVGPRRQGEPRGLRRRLSTRARPAEAPMPAARRSGAEARPDQLGRRDSRRVARRIGAGDGPEQLLHGWQALAARVDACPEPLRDMAARGLKKVVDFQDLAYGGEYLDRLDRAVALDDAGAWLCAVDRGGKASRQRHVLRRHDPRRRPEDPLDARRPGAARGRRSRTTPSCR